MATCGPTAYVPTWRNFRGKIQHDTSLLAVGYGDGGGGVTPEMVEREVQLRDFPALPKARWGHVADFFADAQKRADRGEAAGVVGRDLSRTAPRHADHAVRRQAQAPPGRAGADHRRDGGVAGPSARRARRPTSLEPHWRVVLKNEFHDILPGSSIREVYQDAERELGGAIDAGKAAQADGAGRRIAAQLPKGAGRCAAGVVNPVADRRAGST